jgi:hypothetical protein
MNKRMKHILQFLLLLFFTTLWGCGDSGRIPVYPVRGKVTLDGQPAVGAFVKFKMINGSGQTKWMMPQGTTDEDGTFRLDTYEMGDGAPEGNYNVFINWPTPEDGVETTAPESLDFIREKYANREDPQLQAEVKLLPDSESDEIVIPTFDLTVNEYLEDTSDE